MPGIWQDQSGHIVSGASRPLSRRDYEEPQTLSGAAPVTERSGKSLVVRPYAGHVRLHDTVYHWAHVAIQRDPKSRARHTRCANAGTRTNVLSVMLPTD
jgi:hypothetical protein